jgi:hypothetical protein
VGSLGDAQPQQLRQLQVYKVGWRSNACNSTYANCNVVRCM